MSAVLIEYALYSLNLQPHYLLITLSDPIYRMIFPCAGFSVSGGALSSIAKSERLAYTYDHPQVNCTIIFRFFAFNFTQKKFNFLITHSSKSLLIVARRKFMLTCIKSILFYAFSMLCAL